MLRWIAMIVLALCAMRDARGQQERGAGSSLQAPMGTRLDGERLDGRVRHLPLARSDKSLEVGRGLMQQETLIKALPRDGQAAVSDERSRARVRREGDRLKKKRESAVGD